jgi:hypothetical protein
VASAAAAVQQSELEALKAGKASAAHAQAAARAIFAAGWETAVVHKLPMAEREMDWQYGEILRKR